MVFSSLLTAASRLRDRQMEENLPSTASPPRSPPCSPEVAPDSKHQRSTMPSPIPPSSVIRLWRPAAQRNIRNQWSKLASYRQQWSSASSSARTHATSTVNSYLSQRYMNGMELGALSDMPDIRKKACWKLFKQQMQHRSKFLSSYRDMVAVVVHMVDASKSMRSYLKGAGGPLIQFSSIPVDKNDNGDGGGIPVFTFWSIPAFEELAHELVQMFRLELNLKRLLVVELLTICYEEYPISEVCWSDELYPGEFDDLSICSLYSDETCEPVHPQNCKSDMSTDQPNCQPDHDVLQFSRKCLIMELASSLLLVYLTSWLAEVNIDMYRLEEIFTIVGEEMHITFS